MCVCGDDRPLGKINWTVGNMLYAARGAGAGAGAAGAGAGAGAGAAGAGAGAGAAGAGAGALARPNCMSHLLSD